MGSIVLYIIEWAFALLVLLAIYKAAFSGTTLYRFNRFYLLGATLLSALLPLVHITIPDSNPLVSSLPIDETVFAQELSGTFMFVEEPEMTMTDDYVAPEHKTSLWAVMLVCSYAVYVITLFIGWSRGILRARRFLHGKPRRRISRTVWLITHNEQYGPFSWMNYIAISDKESGFARRASLRHEYSHVRLMHSIDLIILLACTIVNPVCWLVLQEIKIVHEYEADNEVINRYGIHDQDYQRLLIMKAVGAEAYALASSFNLNIKKRIIMMNKNKTRKRRLIWLLLLIPLLGMTSVLFARTEKAIGPDSIATDTYNWNEFQIIIRAQGIIAQKLKYYHGLDGLDEILIYIGPCRLGLDELDELEDFLDAPDLVKEDIQKVTVMILPDAPDETLNGVKTVLRKMQLLNVQYQNRNNVNFLDLTSTQKTEEPNWIGVEIMNISESEQYLVETFSGNDVPDSDIAKNLKSAAKDLFKGKRKAFVVPYSEDNLKKVKEIIARYPNKKVNWML